MKVVGFEVQGLEFRQAGDPNTRFLACPLIGTTIKKGSQHVGNPTEFHGVGIWTRTLYAQ